MSVATMGLVVVCQLDSFPDLFTLWERASGKMDFDDAIKCQKCNSLHNSACSTLAVAK